MTPFTAQPDTTALPSWKGRCAGGEQPARESGCHPQPEDLQQLNTMAAEDGLPKEFNSFISPSSKCYEDTSTILLA